MRILLVFIIAIGYSKALAQEATKTISAEAEKPRLWKIRTFLDYPDYRFLLATGEGRSDLEANNQRLQFNPSNNPEVGFILSRGLFHIGYRTNLSFIENPAYRGYDLGSTDVTDLEFGWDGKYFSLGTFYSRFKGYYVDLNATSGFTVESGDGNTTIVTGEGNDGVPDIWTRPDIETYNYGFYADGRIPIFGKDSLFSPSTEMKQFNQIWDLALVGGIGYQRMAIEGGSPFVPEVRAAIFPEISQLTGIYQHIAFFKMGMTNQINLGKFFLQMDLVGGFEGLTHYERNAATADRKRFSNGERIEATFGFGYGGKYNRFRFRHRSLFRVMETSSASSLDSEMAHTGIEYTYIF